MFAACGRTFRLNIDSDVSVQQILGISGRSWTW